MRVASEYRCELVFEYAIHAPRRVHRLKTTGAVPLLGCTFQPRRTEVYMYRITVAMAGKKAPHRHAIAQ